ncbi:MAG: 3-dehydroquinate synthase [Janthinobacterium lividum]
MRSLQQSFAVTYAYPVHFTTHAFAPENPVLLDTLKQNAHCSDVLCVLDAGVVDADPELPERIQAYANTHRSHMHLVCPPLVLPGGEAGKNTEDAYKTVQAAIHEHGICRQSFVLAVGGGAFLDLVGYAAATAHRGVRLIRMPTTVLSQDDSGVGVKNSVNAFGKKNFVGTFAPPFAVINDFAFLALLSQRDWIGGIAEAVKVALLKDPAFFEFLERHATDLVARRGNAMQHVVHRSAELHLLHIGLGGDPFETTSSRPLDFGHWSAHKLEQMSQFALRHGEAVAIGIALDTTYSYRMGWLRERDWERVLQLLSHLGFSLALPRLFAALEGNGFDVLFHGLTEFREHLGGELTITVLHGIGQPLEVHEIDASIMKRSLEMMEELASSLLTSVA